MKIPGRNVGLILTALCFLTVPIRLTAQGTAFSYQGRLNASGVPATGNYDLTFALFAGSDGESQIANAITNLNVCVTNGLFAVTLDFGNGVFTGSSLWLEVGVRTNGEETFTALAPRQQLNSVPYAVTAAKVTGMVPGASLGGDYPAGVSFTNRGNSFYGTFAGSGDGLTNLDASKLARGIVPLPRLAGITSNQLEAATDAAYRSAAAHASNTLPVINVKDYGAVGDGYADDSAAIAAAFNVWTNIGGTLYFPAGAYVDTNTYNIGPAQPLDYDDTPFFPLTIRGDGKGSSHWLARITNATFLTILFYAPNINDISIENAGFGMNTGFYVIIGATVDWYNVRFSKWTDVGADMEGIPGGCFYGCAFEDCGTGLRVPGYCDGWTGDLRLDGNSRAGLEIGDTAPSYPGVRHTDGGRWHVTGARNYITVLVGGDYSAGENISGYVENSTNCTVAIGHPPEWNDPETTGNLGSVVIENLGVLNYTDNGKTQVLARVYSPPSLLIVRNVAGGQTNVVSTSPDCDATPVIFEGVSGDINMMFSNGSTIPGSSPLSYTTVNLAVRKFNRAIPYYNSTTDGSIALSNNLTVGGSIAVGSQSTGGTNASQIFSGAGSPLNVIAAPAGSMYLRTDGGPGATLYVKEAGTDATGWVGK